MSKQKKLPSSVVSRPFKLTQQILTINEVNFKKQTILGSTELTILPLVTRLTKLTLNCKQCRILSITIDGAYSNVDYSYVDPTLAVCAPESKKRNLDYFDLFHYESVQSCDSDMLSTAGELVIKIPRDVLDSFSRSDGRYLKVFIEFSLEQPKGGVQFVIPPGATPDMQHAHVFTYGWENASRLWFPCVDSYTELCHWSLNFTVSSNMVAVSCGELVEQLQSLDGKKRTFQYSLTVPTSAPCIAFAVGSFQIYPDPVLQEVTHFCLPGLLPVLKNTVQYVHEMLGFYEELLSTRFPHSSFKLVFVDHAYQDVCSYSTLGIVSTNLLYSPRVIDQVFPTRFALAQVLAKQYFGCYVLPQLWSDWWLPVGIAGFMAGLYLKKAFGGTEYQHWIMQEQNKVYQFEFDHTLPPLCTPSALGTSSTSTSSTSATPTGIPPPRSTLHPHLLSEVDVKILSSKAHLIIRMLQLRIGHDLLVQVFNKLLTLASTASQTNEFSLWSNLLISTSGLMKSILTVSGKDMSHFMEQWLCRSGVPSFVTSFTYVRKKNLVELKLKQDLPRNLAKFNGPLTVVVQEFDGCFPHTIQVEESTTVYELPCHSKIRKSKKRKVPLCHGEEVEVDVSSLDIEVPILWLRIDPDFQWIRRVNMEQADTIWQCILKYERDATAQIESILALENFPSSSARDILRDIILNPQLFYHVRTQAGQSLAKMLTDTASSGGSASFLIGTYHRLFGTASHPSIVRYNDFSDVASYLVQKGLHTSIAAVRGGQSQSPVEVRTFLLEVLKYSDNQMNKFTDCYYTASLIDALAKTVMPKVTVTATPGGVDGTKSPLQNLTPEAQAVLQEIVQHLNIEKVLPSYHCSITCSCLRALRVLQKNGHLPSDSSIFLQYSSVGNFSELRITALQCIADIVQAEHSEKDLSYLMDLVEGDEPRVQVAILDTLAANPPFTRRLESKLNTLPLVERLWSLMCSKFSHDSRLRNAAALLYSSLYGRLTPTCVPQGLGIVIDLKEKVARTSMASPVLTTIPPTEEPKSLHSSQAGIGTSFVGQTLSTPTPTQKVPLPGQSLIDAPQATPIKPPPVPLSLKLTVPLPLTPAKLSSPALITPGSHTSEEGVVLDEGVVSPSHQLKKHKSDHKHKKKHKHKEDRHGDQKGEGHKEEHKHKHKHKHSKETSHMEF